MWKLTLVVLATTAAAVACADPDRSTGVQPDNAATLDQNAVNTASLPDLIVDSKSTQNNWLVRVEDFPDRDRSVGRELARGPRHPRRVRGRR